MSSSNITMVLIDKSGTLKDIVVKVSEFHNLYKKAGFSTVENFAEQYLWEITTEKAKYAISLWGKKKGKNAKNVYPFPPPLEENNEFCGNVVLMNYKGQQNLTVAEWTMIYDVLCEQILQREDEEEEDYANDDDVEDEEGDEDEGEEDDGEEEEGEEVYVTPAKSKKKNSKNNSVMDDFVMMNDVSEELLLDCSAELQEESYMGETKFSPKAPIL